MCAQFWARAFFGTFIFLCIIRTRAGHAKSLTEGTIYEILHTETQQKFEEKNMKIPNMIQDHKNKMQKAIKNILVNYLLKAKHLNSKFLLF